MSEVLNSNKGVCGIEVYSDSLTYDQIKPYTEKISSENKAKVLEYMKRDSFEVAAAAGYIFDAVAEEYTKIPLLAYEDGEYSWDGREIFYFERYDLMLKPEFIKKALSN